jgi:aspartyl aminopeptidase
MLQGVVKRARSDVKAGPGAKAGGSREKLAQDMLQFINYAWTPYHAVEEASRRLMAAGFQHISEKGTWDIKAGGKYFFTRNYSTIVAFGVGAKYQPGELRGCTHSPGLPRSHACMHACP